MSPIPMVSIRYTIVALTLFAMLAWRGELLPPRRTWPALFTMEHLGVCINNVTQFTGLQYSTVTNFTIIATLTPS
ncbi:MAG: EamA family transporter [Phascolarctobacterium faecium]